MILLIVLASIVAGWMIIGGIVYGVAFSLDSTKDKESLELGTISIGVAIWPIVLGGIVVRLAKDARERKNPSPSEGDLKGKDVPW